MLLAISRFSASSVVCISHAQSDVQIFNNKKISIQTELHWLVLVAMMLIYYLPAWSLENPGPETEVQFGVALCLLICVHEQKTRAMLWPAVWGVINRHGEQNTICSTCGSC